MEKSIVVDMPPIKDVRSLGQAVYEACLAKMESVRVVGNFEVNGGVIVPNREGYVVGDNGREAYVKVTTFRENTKITGAALMALEDKRFMLAVWPIVDKDPQTITDETVKDNVWKETRSAVDILLSSRRPVEDTKTGGLLLCGTWVVSASGDLVASVNGQERDMENEDEMRHVLQSVGVGWLI